METGIPAGWKRQGEGYFCPLTKQAFESIDALQRSVRYAKESQLKLFKVWVYGIKTKKPVPKRGSSKPHKQRSNRRRPAGTSLGNIVYTRRRKLASCSAKANDGNEIGGDEDDILCMVGAISGEARVDTLVPSDNGIKVRLEEKSCNPTSLYSDDLISMELKAAGIKLDPGASPVPASLEDDFLPVNLETDDLVDWILIF